MTKKTNSLVIRYGINTLWKNKNTLVETLANILQLNKLIYIWLKKKNLNVLDIHYKSKNLRIFVYNQPFIGDKIKSQIIKYYKKNLNLNLVIQKFGIERQFLISILIASNLRGIKNLSFTIFRKNIFSSFISLLLKKYLLFLLYICIDNLKKINKKFEFFFFKGLISILNNFLCVNKKTNFFFFSKFIFLRKLNGFLKLSLLSKSLENTIYSLTRKEIKLKINNIFLNKGFPRVPIFGQKVIKPEFRFKFFTLFISLIYKNSKLLAEHLSELIKKNKQHRKTLQTFTNFFEKIFFSKLLFLSGIQIRATGKLGGKMRRSKYHYKLGMARLQTLKYLVSYSCVSSYTKFGIISIKIWLIQRNAHKYIYKTA